MTSHTPTLIGSSAIGTGLAKLSTPRSWTPFIAINIGFNHSMCTRIFMLPTVGWPVIYEGPPGAEKIRIRIKKDVACVQIKSHDIIPWTEAERREASPLGSRWRPRPSSCTCDHFMEADGRHVLETTPMYSHVPMPRRPYCWRL